MKAPDMNAPETTPTPAVLISDDDRGLREVLRETVERRGYQPLLAGDGLEALEILRSHAVHVAVFDVHMPRLGGLEAIVRVHEMGLDLPCILISARLDDAVRREADRIHAFSVLSKPLSASDFTGLVERAVRHRLRWS